MHIPYLTLTYLTLPYLTLPYLTLPYLASRRSLHHMSASAIKNKVQERSKNSIVSSDISLQLAQLLQQVRCACRRVWGQEPCAALPGVSATQGLHNAAGLAD